VQNNIFNITEENTAPEEILLLGFLCESVIKDNIDPVVKDLKRSPASRFLEGLSMSEVFLGYITKTVDNPNGFSVEEL
jgi:hypothetical protein